MLIAKLKYYELDQHALEFAVCIFFFLKNASLGNYAGDSTLYAYNEILETVICNLRQEFSILSNWL